VPFPVSGARRARLGCRSHASSWAWTSAHSWHTSSAFVEALSWRSNEVRYRSLGNELSVVLLADRVRRLGRDRAARGLSLR